MPKLSSVCRAGVQTPLSPEFANAASRNPDCGVISALFDEALEPGNSLSSIAAKDVLVSRHGYQVCAPTVAKK